MTQQQWVNKRRSWMDLRAVTCICHVGVWETFSTGIPADANGGEWL